jgi:hypothetical protein
MVNVTEGMSGSLAYNGTVIALLASVDLSWSRSATEWASMGETATSDVLLGVKKHKGNVKMGFTDWAYKSFFTGGSQLIGTLYPIGGTGTTLAGTMVFTAGKLTNIKQDSEAAVLLDQDFIFYNVTQVPA